MSKRRPVGRAAKYQSRRAKPADKRRDFSLRGISVENLEPKLMMTGPQLVGISPNEGDLLSDGTTRNVAPQELTFRFDDNQVIDSATLRGIQVVRTSDRQVVQPGYVGIGESPNEVIIRFADTLSDDSYRIDITGSGTNALRNVAGEAFNSGVTRSVSFDLDLAPLITAIVPQPVTRVGSSLSQARNQIEVYFNDDDLSVASAERPQFYQLIYTSGTATNTDDVVHLPIDVDYTTAQDKATLTFAGDLSTLSTGAGTYRLRIGTDESIPAAPIELSPPSDVGATFGTSFDLGVLGREDRVISETISSTPYGLSFPGDANEPGRVAPIITPDTTQGVTTKEYNFRSVLTRDAAGNPIFNLVTETQKTRAREVIEIISAAAGVQFVETEDRGIAIGTASIPGFTVRRDLVAVPFSFQDDAFGGDWSKEAMRQLIGQLTGEFSSAPNVNFTIEDPTRDFSFVGLSEEYFPRFSSQVNLQAAFRPDANDVDVYRFNVTSTGVLSAELVAARAGSNLDGAVRLYRQQGTQSVLIAQNDDYYGTDSLVDIELGSGTYFVTVASTGNEYDPIADSGIGGRSEGAYDLRLNFKPGVSRALTDASGLALDGDANGIAGGVYDFWFQVGNQADTIFVDKSATGSQTGSIASPFNNIASAFAASSPGDIVRVVGNGGADGNVASLADNLAYEIGFNQFGTLADGGSLVVPQGVTLMVDAGAIFKLRQSSIQVGSSSVSIDLSGAAIQVLGTPFQSVIFTSYDDESTGRDSNPLPTSPDPGDWGGILIRNDVDRAEGNFDYEQIGAFPNYVNHADMRYGGGRVLISSVEQVINPVHLIDSRAEVSYNVITRSADAAISANPDAFEETRFHAIDSLGIDYQTVPYTADYSRVGPDIHRNTLFNNTVNGLFIRINTPASRELERMTVAGRWDDLDIVHVVPENIIIEGQPGGPVVDADGNITARPKAGLTIDPGTIVKLDGSRIEATLGTHLYAEGTDAQPIIFTSLLDNRYGVGGTFDTSNNQQSADRDPTPGDWSGIYAAPTSSLSLDNVVVAYGGGLSRLEGSFAGFNAIEAHQGDVRIVNSTLEFNASGRGGQADLDRTGRPNNEKGAIFIRGSEAIIVSNIIRGTTGYETPAISIDVNSLNYQLVGDMGRSTGSVDRFDYADNQGALVRANRLSGNSLNGMHVRGGTVATEIVLDDTDMVHLVFDEINIPSFQTYGGVRLESSSTESLVIKLAGPKAGFVSSGVLNGSIDPVGGMLHVIGQPGHPVVMTSLYDDTVGAGFDTSGEPLNTSSSFNRPLPTQRADSFQIDLNFGPTMRDLPAMREAAELAARIWETLLEDPIRVTIDIDLATLPAGTLGLTTNEYVFFDFDDVVGAISSDATGRPHEAITSRIPDFELFDTTVILPDDPINPFRVQEVIALSQANAKALGYDQNELGTAVSAFDSTEFVDSTIRINDNVFWDLDRGDGILPNANDLAGVILHEIGHALGFESVVDDVDIALGSAAASRDIAVFPLDLFRLSPGEGEEDFRNAGRNLNPRATHVLYDGGFFDPVTPLGSRGIDIPGLAIGDIPMATGEGFGDGGQAGHFKDLSDFDTQIVLGLMDPSTGTGVEVGFSQQDRQMFDLIGYDVVGGAVPGDWRGVTLETFSHDSNVAISIERESASSSGIGNAVPDVAEFLGSLAASEKAGDENNRLGFTVHGALSQNSDVDVYSFDGVGGTQVWIDIDRTKIGLDTVVELIDANGRILAQSDNSVAGTPTSATLDVNPMAISPFGGTDYWGTNVRDAGMRVVLPGAAGSTNTYHVRVRSSSNNLNVLSAGQSSGVYQLQVRLSEVDRLPGSTVRYADISYAVDGVRVRGLPNTSPLTGSVSEDASRNEDLPIATFDEWNMLSPEPPRISDRITDPELFGYIDLIRDPLRTVDDPFFARTTDPTETEFQGPQLVGDVIRSRNGSINISGALIPPASDDPLVLLNADEGALLDHDIDWYQFEVGAPTSLIFDVDYAAGIAGPDASIYVYQAVYSGDNMIGAQLIFSSENGNDIDDQPAPLAGADLARLSGGSVSKGDPFLGPVPVARGTYLVAITAGLKPIEYQQFTVGVPPIDPEREPDAGRGIVDPIPVPNNPFIRMEPIPSVTRVVEERFNSDGAVSAVPHHLGDVPLFISTTDGVASSTFTLVNPFSGSRGGVVGTTERPIGDFDLRDEDMNFYAYTLGDTNANSGNYIVINPADGSFVAVDFDPGQGGGGGGGGANQGTLTDDGVEPSSVADDGTGVLTVTANDVGIQYQAFEFFDENFGYAVGNHGDNAQSNILFRFNVPRGDVDGDAQDDDQIAAQALLPAGGTAAAGGWTNILAVGPILPAVDVAGTGSVLSVMSDVVVLGDLNIHDGDQISVGAPGADAQVLEFNLGPELVLDIDPAAGRFFIDGDTFAVNGVSYEVNTGSVLVANGLAALADGDTLTISNNNVLNPRTVVFEFDTSGNGVSAGNVAVAVTSAGVDTFGRAVSDAVAAANFGVSASFVGNRISFAGESSVRVSNAAAMALFGGQGVAAGNTAIQLEETYTVRQIGESFETLLGASAVALNDRIVFPGSTTDFDALEGRGIAIASQATTGVTPGTTAIDLLLSDSRDDVAGKIGQALSGLGFTATVHGWQLALAVGSAPRFATSPANMPIGGTNPGGNVTGMQFLGGKMYVVTDRGGLYTVNGFAGALTDRSTDYIETSTLLNGARFSGLTAGPADIEGGRYKDMLFATTSRGEIYAFDTFGQPQPVFVNGQSSVATGVAGANGLQFSPADESLWHIGDRRGVDIGHGDVSDPADPGLSFQFGDSEPDPALNRNFNYPGGTHGTLVTDAFSLEGYVANDQPVMYFNYLLASDGGDPSSAGTDSFRVFVVDDSIDANDQGQWVLVAASDVIARGVQPLFDNTWEDQPELYPEDPGEPNEDTFILRRNGIRDPYTTNRSQTDDTGAPLDNPPPFPVPSEQETVWRQARIDLSGFAGSDNLRIRFDFSTSGSFGLGDPNTGGSELRAIAGDLIADGEQFTIGAVKFEFDQGLSLSTPSSLGLKDREIVMVEAVSGNQAAFEFVTAVTQGNSLLIPSVPVASGDRFSLTSSSGRVIFEFDDDGQGTFGSRVPIVIDPLNLPASIAAAINQSTLGVTATAQGSVIRLAGGSLEVAPLDTQILATQQIVIEKVLTSAELSGRLTAAINGSDALPSVTARAVNHVIDLQGAKLVNLVAGSGFVVEGTAGQNNPAETGVHVIGIDSSMTSEEVAQLIAVAVAEEFAGGELGAVKAFQNVVSIHGVRVTNQGPLGLSDKLAGDAGHPYKAERVVDNEFQFVITQDTQGGGGGGGGQVDDQLTEVGSNFIVPYLGAYVDDLIIGFASRGEQIINNRESAAEFPTIVSQADDEAFPVLKPQTQRRKGSDYDIERNLINGVPPLLPDDQGGGGGGGGGNVDGNPDGLYDGQEWVVLVDRSHFIPETPSFEIDPSFTGSALGPYQLEIRTASPITVTRLNQGILIDPQERFSPSTTLIAPAGYDIYDGLTIGLTNGNQDVTLEYNDLALSNGVAAGNIAIPFASSDSPEQIAERIRGSINSAVVRNTLKVSAAAPDGTVTGPADSNVVQIFGLVFPDPDSAVGFEVTEATDSLNRTSGAQGQIIVESNTIQHSLMFGVVAEDGYRTVPDPASFDPDGLLVHSPNQIGEFTSNLGAARDLVTLNKDNVVPGVVIQNNVIARGGAGGVHLSGDPGGFIVIPPIGGDANQSEVWDNYPFIVSITDRAGKTIHFEFDTDGVVTNEVPVVPFTFQPAAGGQGGAGGGANTAACPYSDNPCVSREAMADIMVRAITSSGLDVLVYQNPGDLIFIEGAQSIVGNLDITGDLEEGDDLLLGSSDWFTPWYKQVPGLRTYTRVLNNTIVGLGGPLTDNRVITVDVANPLPGEDAEKTILVNDYDDAGILIDDGAYPTVLNNIVVNFESGIRSDVTSKDSVVGGMLYQRNIKNADGIGVGDFPIELASNASLFVDIASDNFYLSGNSLAIDSSIDSLEDRPGLVSLKQPVGIPRSNLLAPNRDVLGQLREDDPNVETPRGLGQNVFKDRGAIDRVDFLGPTVSLLNPRDNDSEGIDKNPAATRVDLEAVSLSNFTVQFVDAFAPGEVLEGTGVDAATVTSNSISVTQDGRLLTAGVDYRFSYDATNRVIRLTPIAGVWPGGSSYVLRLSNTVKDVAGNALRSNQTTGETIFVISTVAGSDYGDAPVGYPTLLSENGARHTLVPDFFLGGGVTSDADGQPNRSAAGDGADDGVTFVGDFLRRGESNTITVQASKAGLLDAWIDFNQDGDWNDAGERIFSSRALTAGSNSLPFAVPSSIPSGEAFARFRFSSTGGLATTGAAADGEVEDYLVAVDPGNVWQNTSNQFDANGDGDVTPFDVLRVIRETNDRLASDRVTSQLFVPAVEPNTPDVVGFVDVNGDGHVTARDVLAIIRFINDRDAAAGEPADDSVDVVPMGDLAAALQLDDVMRDLYHEGTDEGSIDEALAEMDWIGSLSV